MPDALDEVVDGLEIGLNGAELVQVQAAADRLLAKLGVAYGDFDAGEGWDLDAATSMTAWLGDHAGMAGGDAARVVRSARCLRALPVTSAAALDGTLSAGQVRAIVANVSPAAVELFADHEGDLVATLAPLSVADVAVAMRTWAALADDALDTGEAAEASSSLFLSSSLEGRWHLDGGLDALSGEILHTALALAKSPDAEGEPSRSPGERRADALVDICSFFLENHEHPAGSRHRPHVNVIVTLEDLQAGRGGECADGTVFDGASLASLVCHSTMHRVLMAGPVLVDYGTATKTISANLYNAVVVRDRHCRSGPRRNYLGSFRAVDLQRSSLARAQVVSLRPRPGCDRPPAWADVHHVVHTEDGGPTSPSNCVLLCRRHHTRLHRKGWSAELKPDGELVVHNPDGRVFTSHPPGSRPRPPPALFAA